MRTGDGTDRREVMEMSTESTYVEWLESKADELEAEADEDEAFANGSWITGGTPTQYHYDRLDLVEEKRARAREYRREASELRRKAS